MYFARFEYPGSYTLLLRAGDLLMRSWSEATFIWVYILRESVSDDNNQVTHAELKLVTKGPFDLSNPC